MGYSGYSDDAYKARMAYHKSTGTSYFSHDAAINSGKVDKKVHEKLDASVANKAGKLVRESFDSVEHPNSRAIVVMFDVTGSMREVPGLFKDKLNKLMAALTKKGYVSDPQIMFGAIGDATSDAVPLQVGQFESGNEMDESLSLIYLEGGGGGQKTESYELAMYYVARHTEIDCFTKRGEKGYCFIIGDETPYSEVKASEVEAHIGDKLQSNIPTAEIVKELQSRYEVFWIMPGQASYWDDKQVNDTARRYFGQNFLKLEDPNDIVEFIVSTIGLSEGYDLTDIKKDLKDIGADDSAIDRSSSALVAYSSGKSLTKTGKASAVIPKSKAKDRVAKV